MQFVLLTIHPPLSLPSLLPFLVLSPHQEPPFCFVCSVPLLPLFLRNLFSLCGTNPSFTAYTHTHTEYVHI